MGGSNIIEVGEEDIIIPAYTDRELTVKGMTAFKPSDFGFSKMDIGEFTPTSNASYVNLPHNLGVTPKVVLIYAVTNVFARYLIKAATCAYAETGSEELATLIYNNNYVTGDQGVSKCTFQSMQVQVQILTTYTSIRFSSGTKYKYIVMA